jgi:hypothetical protein
VLAQRWEQAEKARESAFLAAHASRAAIGGSEPPPVVRDTPDPVAVRHDLTTLVSWLRARLPLLDARARLLEDWHREVSGATTQLHPELIRYAHVVAATTIGTASRPELSDVDFDLAIVDEAGQIGTADLLVPLVRARRAVLVGGRCWSATSSSYRRSSTPRSTPGARTWATRASGHCSRRAHWNTWWTACRRRTSCR